MRVMISQPMKGLTLEEIKANRAEAVARLEAEGHVVVDSIVKEEPPADSNAALHCLGQSFQIMAKCDAVLFLEGWDKARGCRMERAACEAYGVKVME